MAHYYYQKNKIDKNRLWQFITKDDLPNSLYQIANLIGLEATKALINFGSGRKIYVPNKARAKSKLTPIVGQENLQILAEAMGGCYLDFREVNLSSSFNDAFWTMVRKEREKRIKALDAELIAKFNLNKNSYYQRVA